jgi:hypothetical protein
MCTLERGQALIRPGRRGVPDTEDGACDAHPGCRVGAAPPNTVGRPCRTRRTARRRRSPRVEVRRDVLGLDPPRLLEPRTRTPHAHPNPTP